ncbi:MAG: MotA/TolQ/ExbB proton channel family protein [Methylobacterium sp.]|jgi:chemotaxis protein MotA|nr:MotA/TolQ/ExbB proton channel family protein [Methylobacterium sp.]MCA3597402.1 MotA/TolQ/ExbB proton channel family protein [Methylobacterium sp.]MCA3599776.1 MotA/TolQ/ExbB proton channel family protein [Methylobacterium sp.]MCA3602894.1 MotA/TolQ/ExbB proton channel family protein [Methylobacterium sp.]MCA3606293.1 MotA/TolQ/ExbB proton channel family protein [Methylobacterium sp.]
MDIATAIGLFTGSLTIIVLVLMDGSFGIYLDKHAFIVIFGGAISATLIRYPMSMMLHGLPMGLRFAFQMRKLDPRGLIEEITKIAEIMRKSGPMSLETYQVDDAFLAQGIRYVVDGYDADFIKSTMEQDRDTFLMHLDEGQKIYRAIGDCAPAWGMIGTLLGMVNMFANMEDPSKLGPFMAVALLATLYGAVVANLFCLPIADKLHVKLEEEDVSRSLIIDGVLQIRQAKSPSIIREMLISYLPDHHKVQFLEAEAAA